VDLGPCVVAGQLWDLGPYPGLVPGEGRVVGELYLVRDPTLLSELDVFEGYDAGDLARSEYVRRAVRLIEPEVEAWVYFFNGPLEGRLVVASGDWAAYLRGRGPRGRGVY